MKNTTVSPTSLSKVNQRTTYRKIHQMMKKMNKEELEKRISSIRDFSLRIEAEKLMRACYIS